MKSVHFIKVTSLLLALSGLQLSAQTLYIPSGTVGTSANGYVGIGTSNPNTMLDVVGNATIRGAFGVSVGSGAGVTTEMIKLMPAGGSNTAGTAARIAGYADVISGYIDFKRFVAGGPVTGLVMGTFGGDVLTIRSGNSADPGNVGIGTSTPAYKLDLRTPGSSATQMHIAGTDTDAGGYFVSAGADNMWMSGGIAYNGSAWKAKASAWGLIGTGGGYVTIFTGNGATVGDSVTLATRLTVDPSGNVGIGTTNPTQKLAVNGTIRAKEVIVDTGWSDYVFAPDYKLAPLSEVETHIKENGHLPGIPSAKEVAEHGVSMGEMQSKLLAKIEELTLHQIEQEKQLRAQTERLASQMSLLATQSRQLEQQADRIAQLENETTLPHKQF